MTWTQPGIAIKRAYEPADPSDGYRFLVDRLWPRGVGKEEAAIDDWDKHLAPSSELRRWYGHDPARWEEFRRRYRHELERPEVRPLVRRLAERATQHRVTLVSASRAIEISDAAVLRDLLLDVIHARAAHH